MDIEQCWQQYMEGEVATIRALECIFLQVFHIAIRLAGIAVFIMLIIGGFGYLTSGGDPKKSQSAKNTITYAILGLALLILAWFILFFVEKFTGITVTEFKIGQ